MIILAGAVVLTLGNTGIIEKARYAVNITNEASVRTFAEAIWAEAYLNTDRSQEKLEEYVFSKLRDEKIDLSEYSIEVTTKGVNVVKGWMQDGLYVKKGLKPVKDDSGDFYMKIEIGDDIVYDETAGGTKTVDKDVSWKVLGANDKGELLIISAQCVKSSYKLSFLSTMTDDAEKMAEAKKDWIYGAQELNEVCEQYKYGKSAIGASSITVEDINKITGYNPEEMYGKGNINEYNNEITYMWKDAEEPYYRQKNGNENYLTENGHKGKFLYYNGKEFITSSKNGATSENPVEITTLKTTFYYYYPTTLTQNKEGEVKGLSSDEKAYKMLFEESDGNAYSNYWLADSYMNTHLAGVRFGMRHVDEGLITGVQFIESNGKIAGNYSTGIRAVVSLSPEVKLTGSSETGWKY